jgi:hypothetical protein
MNDNLVSTCFGSSSSSSSSSHSSMKGMLTVLINPVVVEGMPVTYNVLYKIWSAVCKAECFCAACTFWT